jgi:nicotinamidase-related amidase
VRHIVHEPNPPHLPYREEHFGYVHLPVSIPTEQAALVLVDCWDQIIVESFQERAERISEETIRPVLEASRAAGITVVHAPSPPLAEKFREFWPEDCAQADQPAPAADADWPPTAFAQRQGEWAHLQARRSGLHQDQLDRIDRDRSIHAAVLPQPGDAVVAAGDQLHRLCRERGILYLFYVGFATNICVPDRDYGMRAMRERGYALVLLRDATTGVEASDTYPMLAATSVMIHQFELRDIAGTITSNAFLAALEGE